jgi:hypothetical protein
MSWLPETPQFNHLEPINLRDGDPPTQSGYTENDWIHWKLDDSFTFKSWYRAPFGFEGMKNLITKIHNEFNKARRTNFKRDMNAKGYSIDWLPEDFVLNKFKPHTKVSAFSHVFGAIPAIIWQTVATGQWYLVTKYGIAEEIMVSVHKDHEWMLRNTTKLGFIYFFGEGIRESKYRTVQRITESNGGITKWKYEDVPIELWGHTGGLKNLTYRTGINLGGEYWKSLTNLKSKMKVGGVSVISDNLCPDRSPKAFERWVIDEVYDGKSIGYLASNGNFRKEHGFIGERISDERYEEIWEKTKI